MLNYASITNSGGRMLNEDCLKISCVSNRHCFVVCDGLGGHDSGNVASKIAANSFVDELYYCEDLSEYLLKAFDIAQKQVLFRQKENDANKEMKTTAVCLVTDEDTFQVGHVGDSRFYGFKNDGTYIRTLDHSMPQLLVQSNTITEAEIRKHPSRNMLLKAIGDESNEQLCDLSDHLPLSDFRAFLLCSDGFWELVDEDEMLFTLSQSSSPQEWLDKMSEIITGKANDISDNYSAIAIII